MVTENIKAFFEALSQTESLQQALKAKELAYTGSKEDRAAVIEAVLIPVAKEAGYAFTLEELKAFERSMRAEVELAENELEAVAGGVENWGVCFIIGAGWGDMCTVGGLAVCVIAGTTYLV